VDFRSRTRHDDKYIARKYLLQLQWPWGTGIRRPDLFEANCRSVCGSSFLGHLSKPVHSRSKYRQTQAQSSDVAMSSLSRFIGRQQQSMCYRLSPVVCRNVGYVSTGNWNAHHDIKYTRRFRRPFLAGTHSERQCHSESVLSDFAQWNRSCRGSLAQSQSPLEGVLGCRNEPLFSRSWQSLDSAYRKSHLCGPLSQRISKH
jgi:hypothetical protein